MLLMIEQSGVASSTKVPPNLKQRESVKLKGSVKKGKQEPMDHHQTQHSSNSLALFATDSLELKLAYTVINEHTNTHKRLMFRNQDGHFSVMRDEQSLFMIMKSYINKLICVMFVHLSSIILENFEDHTLIIPEI